MSRQPSPSADPGPDARRGGRRAAVAVLLAAAALAAWMDLSPLHKFHDSDSLVPILMSLYRWQPFYWNQDRFGMLVPLLARPFVDPFHNLLAQEALRLFAGVLSFFLLARAVLPRPFWPAAGAATLALFVAEKNLYAHCYFAMQPYGQAMTFALAAIVLLDGLGARRWAAARIALSLLAMGLAFWISVSTLLWLLPLLCLRRLLRLAPAPAEAPAGHPSLWREVLPFVLVGVAFGASVLASRLYPWHATNLGSAAPGSWPAAWHTLAWRGLRFLKPRFVAAGAVLLAGVAVAALARRGGRARLALRIGLCLAGTAAVELAALGASSWVHINGLSLRFASTGLLAAATAVPAMLLVLVLEGRPRWHAAANAVALAALVPLVWLRFGPPSPAAARAGFDRLGRAAPQVVAAASTHVAGDYWGVWPTVLRADQIRYEQGLGPVWGITIRSWPTADLWRPRSWRAARIAVLDGDGTAGPAFRTFALPPLFLVAVRPGIRVYSGEPPAGGPVVSFPPPGRRPPALPSKEPAVR